MKKQFLSDRGLIALIAGGMWLLLALWSLSAFWSHIDSLHESYKFAARLGAMGGEFALLALILLKCFNPHINVRIWSLIFGFVLALVIIVHAGALRGMNEAKTTRLETEQRLANVLTDVSTKQAAELASSAPAGQTQRERNTIAGKVLQGQTDIAKNTQQTIAAEIVKTDAVVKESSILPIWYLNGWCYSVIFILSLLFLSIVFAMMMNKEDLDRNFDNVPDHQQPEMASSTTTIITPPPVAVSPVAAAPVAPEAGQRQWTFTNSRPRQNDPENERGN